MYYIFILLSLCLWCGAVEQVTDNRYDSDDVVDLYNDTGTVTEIDVMDTVLTSVTPPSAHHSTGRLSLVDLLQVYTPTTDRIQNEKCRQHSLHYLKELKKFSLWATQMFDSSTKFPNGVLIGSTFDLGNFDECVQVNVEFDSDERIKGQYCLANIKFDNPLWTEPDVGYHNSSTESAWARIKMMSQDPTRRSRNEVNVALCVPATCSAHDVETHLKHVLNTLTAGMGVRSTVHVDDRMCQVDESVLLSIGDVIITCVFALCLLVLGMCTSYDLLTSMKGFEGHKVPGKLHEVLVSFSATSNLLKIINYTPAEDGLDCIHGLKFSSICLIIMGHRIMFVLGSPIVNTEFVEGFYSKIEAMILLNGPIVVDTFFNISGFLVCYLLLNEFRKRSTVSIPMLYMHRIIRLTPAYLAVLGFYCTLFVKMGSGPLWHEKVGLEAERCASSWWTNLLYINNYVKTDSLCMIQSWYITCDMHLFIVSPFIVYLLYKKPSMGKLVLSGLFVLSLLVSFLVTYFGKLDALLLLYMKTLRDPISNPTFRNIYIPTHTRASPYFVGMATGYLRYKMKYSNIAIPKMLVWFGWLLAIICIEGTVFSAWIFYIPGRPYDALTSAIYGAFHRTVWSLGTSWMILAMSTGNGAFVEPIFSWRPIATLSKLSYCAFLCHGGLQLYTVATARTPFYGSIYNLIWLSLGDITMSFFMALGLTLMFESPILGLEKILLPRDSRAAHKKNDDEPFGRKRMFVAKKVLNLRHSSIIMEPSTLPRDNKLDLTD